jgi:hypothetical protein
VEIIIGTLMVLYMMHVMLTWEEEPLVFKLYRAKHPGEENGDRYTCEVQHSACVDEEPGNNCCD